MIQEALYKVTHGRDLSYDLAKDTMNKIMSGDGRGPYGWFLVCPCSERPYCR